MQPTAVILPGKCYGQRSLEATVHGIANELDRTEHAGTQRSLPGSLQSVLFTVTISILLLRRFGQITALSTNLLWLCLN